MPGKGGRRDRLPLPVDVGEAIADYLRRGRPRQRWPELFLRVQRPICADRARHGVLDVVRAACRRAGIAEVGAHRLRHTRRPARWSQRRVRCSEIGQVLRHRRLQTHRDLRAASTSSAAAARSAVAGERGDDRARSALDDYLRLRRALGFKLERQGRSCRQLVAYLERRGASTVTRRAGDRVGQVAGRRAPAPLGGAAGDRARVRRLPADDRPGDRGPARGPASPSGDTSHALPVLRCGDRRAAAGGARRCGRR